MTLEDLLAAPVPAQTQCGHNAGVLVNGDLPIPPDGGAFHDGRGGVYIAKDYSAGGSLRLAFGDITGDGIDDGALVLECDAGGVISTHSVQTYTNGRTWLGAVDIAGMRGGVDGISIADGVVHLELLTHDNDDAGCCPSVHGKAKLRWDGKQIVMEPPQPAAAAAGAVDPEQYRFKENFAFTTPSGKFTCGMILTGSSYDPRSHAGCTGETAPIPPRPESCAVGPTWGAGLQVLVDGDVTFICTGGMIYGRWDATPTAVLDYGRSLTAGEFTCSVAESGVTCIHNPTGHGFTIAAESNDIF